MATTVQVRNWDRIEKEAEGKVRSPDFKEQFEKQAKQVCVWGGGESHAGVGRHSRLLRQQCCVSP